MQVWDVIVIGAGAAGLHCAATAAARGNSVLVVDHAKQAGKKILISGGGRCNFTNLYAAPENFISNNPHFCKSALNRYTQWDFIALVDKHNIAWHEKTLGQLFCNESARQIVAMLVSECNQHGAQIRLRTEVNNISYENELYSLSTSAGALLAHNLVLACGGLSMPKLGATAFGYRIAEQFGHSIEPVRAALVPFTLHDNDKASFSELAGLSVDVTAENDKASFKEAMLFTHRGLSGPAMLQISSYWLPGETVSINLMPNVNAFDLLTAARQQQPKLKLTSWLQQYFPKRLAQTLAEREEWPQQNLADFNNQQLTAIASTLQNWTIKPNGTEGYRTAEVTLGGVNVNEVSSKTMQSKIQPGLYFIGEVLDVTGWLGGYNFQWAWSSAWACGNSI